MNIEDLSSCEKTLLQTYKAVYCCCL